MSDDRLEITLAGDLASRIRAAADAAGTEPVVWVVQSVAARLQATQTAGPDSVSPARPGSPESLTDANAWEQVNDPTGTSTVELPLGWQHRIQSFPSPTGNRQQITSTSPDGDTTITNGDPQLPMFVPPGGFLMPGAVMRPPTPADQFAAEYLQHHLGGRPGFQVLAVRESPQLLQQVQQAARQGNIPLTWATTAQVLAEFTDGGRPRSVLALVLTAGTAHMWYATVSHVITDGDAAAFADALLRVVTTSQSTPQEKQRIAQDRMRIDAQHQATMGSIQANTQAMTARHQQNMANIQASGQAHQAKMAGMQAQWDSQFQSWQQRQASQDSSHNAYLTGVRNETGYGAGGGNEHQDFLNAIKEERTVVDAQGWDRQVAAGPDKFYHREHDDSWIGLEQHQDIHDVPGINPDDYYETPIKS